MTRDLPLDDALTRAIHNGHPDEIARISALIDKADTRPAPQLLPSALWYAAQGLRVFPLTPNAKIPLPASHGCKDATTDAPMIRAWWRDNPTANIGIATGHLVDVIDVDGPEGVHTWLGLTNVPPILGQVSTPRPGGHHLYVAAIPGRRNKTAMFPGIDYRGQGGYVVAPPSSTPQGTYVWYRPLEIPTHDHPTV